MKKPLFSITKKDLDVQTFKAGGKGGQHQNKTDSACRIVHKESGAVGESRSERSQYQNKRIALKRLLKDPKMKIWLNRTAHEKIQGETIEQRVDKMMVPENLKIEMKDENGKWRESDENSK